MQEFLNRVIHGDCTEIMQYMPSECIDLTITSPPYDNLRNYTGYKFEFETIAKELYRLTKQGGVVVWIVGDATIKGTETGSSFKQALYFKEIGFNLHDTMIYEKDSCPFPEINRYYPSFEYMFIISKGKPKTYNLIKDKPNKRAGESVTGSARQIDGTLKPHNSVVRNLKRKIKDFGVRTNVWKYEVGKWKVTKDKIAYNHPAIFPEKLAQDHIISWSNEWDIVFDPMCGSGTTLKMACLNNRSFIGIDCSEDYCKISKERLRIANEHK